MSGYIPKRIESKIAKRYLYFYKSIIHNHQKVEGNQAPTDGRMEYRHTMQCYFAIKRKEILTPATKWVDLKDIMLSDISQLQKDKYLYEVSIAVKFMEIDSKRVTARTWEGEMGGFV